MFLPIPLSQNFLAERSRVVAFDLNIRQQKELDSLLNRVQPIKKDRVHALKKPR
jgi:hypothetical protein